jgi:ectoine hydroxylase-related dioxygenase (phytanoyl-CoA dioxygenase family)
MPTTSYPRGFLTDALVDEYRETGFLTLNSICSLKEIRSWQEECRRLWETVEVSEDNPRILWRDRINGGRVADRIDPVLDISPLFERLTADSRFVRAAADVLNGDPGVFKSTLISKWPGTTGYNLHQDYPNWSSVDGAPSDHFVNVLIPIDPIGAGSGATEVFPRYHHVVIEDLPDETIDETAIDLGHGVTLSLAPGDVALIHPLTPHRSGPNVSTNNRESLLVTYVRAGHGDL